MGNTNSALNRDPPKAHRMLCGLRYDNSFGFASTQPNAITNTCFNDVVLEPLATWTLLLVVLPILAVVLMRARSSTVSSNTFPLIRYRIPDRKSLVAFNVVYVLLVIAALLMNVLQIVRLALADRGVGLLPFNLAGILIVLGLMHARSTLPSTVGLAVLAFWSMLLTFTAVALAGLGKLKGVEERLGTEYLLSDEMIDVGVMIGLYAVFWIIEAARLVVSRRHQGARLNEEPYNGADGGDKVALSV